jgi:hypothetical protein
LSDDIQQPGIEDRASRDFEVCTRSVSAECEGTPVFTGLHVGPHQGQLGVRCVKQLRRLLEVLLCAVGVTRSQQGFAFAEQPASLDRLAGSRGGLCSRGRGVECADQQYRDRWPPALHPDS